MCEFLVRTSDNRILTCQHDNFKWGALESYRAFKASHRVFEEWPNKLFLVKCNDMAELEGETLVGKILDLNIIPNIYNFDEEYKEFNLPRHVMLLGA